MKNDQKLNINLAKKMRQLHRFFFVSLGFALTKLQTLTIGSRQYAFTRIPTGVTSDWGNRSIVEIVEVDEIGQETNRPIGEIDGIGQ